jgi:hypothetical protein
VYNPLNPGEVIYGLDVNELDMVTIGGTDYVGNLEYNVSRYFDWDVTFEPKDLKYLFRIQNTEGYVTSATNVGTNHGPIYNYFRRDHLGNNREVWTASYVWGSTTYAARTVQRTQYYPSGLPWASNSGDNPSMQNKKYNGRSLWKCMGWMSMIVRHGGIIRLLGGLRVWIHMQRNITRYHRMCTVRGIL